MSASHDAFGENGLGTWSDASQHTLAVNPVPQNSCGSIEFHVCARRVSDGASKVFHFRAGFKRETGDATGFGITLLSSMGTSADLLALATVSVDVQANDDGIDLLVSGLASTEIDWSCITAGKYLQHVA